MKTNASCVQPLDGAVDGLVEPLSVRTLGAGAPPVRRWCVLVVAAQAIGCGVARVLAPLDATVRLTSAPHARSLMDTLRPDVVVVATESDPDAALVEMERLHRACCGARFVFMTGLISEAAAIHACHAGAERIVKTSFPDEGLLDAVRILLPMRDTSAPSAPLQGGERLIGTSEATSELRSQLARVATVPSNVLIVGETGTGKELAAELIHLNGTRAERPFVCLNTAAIPDALLESELFGHERGAFTGAACAQRGKLGAAQGGTVFLDEIGEVSLSVQAKLLRVLESKTVFRVGGTRGIQLDVRIVAATNQNLERAVEAGTFRRDLYYRLNVLRVDLPALRERREDIPLLVAHYIHRFNRELGRRVRGLTPRSMDTLCAHDWPGNVRELRNVVEAMMVNLAPETTGIVDVPPVVMRQLAVAVSAPASERERLLAALTATNWNKSQAASRLRCSRMTLYRKMHLYGLALDR